MQMIGTNIKFIAMCQLSWLSDQVGKWEISCGWCFVWNFELRAATRHDKCTQVGKRGLNMTNQDKSGTGRADMGQKGKKWTNIHQRWAKRVNTTK